MTVKQVTDETEVKRAYMIIIIIIIIEFKTGGYDLA